MATQISIITAISESEMMKQRIKGSLLAQVSTGLGGNLTRDTNIYKFQEGKYDSSRLVNKVTAQLSNVLNFSDDDGTIDSQVSSNWQAIFDVPLT